MEPSGSNQGLTLHQFLFNLATNPQLQLTLAGIYRSALHKFLVEQGLSDEDVSLFVDAQFSDEGKKRLVEKLTRDCKATWSCSVNQSVVMDE